MSKTKEEILKDCFYKMYPDNGLGEFEDIHHGYCYDAMQEYADQQTEALRKENAELSDTLLKELDIEQEANNKLTHTAEYDNDT